MKIHLPCGRSVELSLEEYRSIRSLRELCKSYCPLKRDPKDCLYYLTKAI